MDAQYILKHKDLDTAYFSLDEDGDLYDFDIINKDHMPILGNQKKNLGSWIQDRSIPDSRPDLNKILREAGCDSAHEYMIRNLALSLSDSYWICPVQDRELKWNDVNLYRHPTGILTFKNGLNGISRKAIKNNSSLVGTLEKYNSYKDGYWHLVKRSDRKFPDGLQNVNEAFATLLHKRQGFQEYTRYTLGFNERQECDVCDCRYFTDESHELVSAYNVTGGIAGKAESAKEAYQDYVEICVANGLGRDYVTNFMDYMLLTDFIITNTDRHWENFGILRDPDSLQFLSLAPIFDSGTSMLCDEPYAKTRLELLQIPFHGICPTQEENLELVHNKNVVDISKLPTSQEVFRFYADRGIRKGIAEHIAQGYKLKRDMLLEFQRGLPISVSSERECSGLQSHKSNNNEKKCNETQFVVLCGIPDSGKQELAKRYIRDESQTVWIRTNDIRKQAGLLPDEDESVIFDTAYKQILYALRNGKDVIYIATNLDRETRQEVLEFADNIPNVTKTLVVMQADPLKIHSDLPKQKLQSMAEILSTNMPDISEGWDRIELHGLEAERTSDYHER